MKHTICVALDNIRSAQNVGSIFRSSDAFGISRLYLCGITPGPSDKKVLKTSLGSEKSVPWEHKHSILELINHLKKKGYMIVSLEQTKESIDIEKISVRKDALIIVGNEVSGISKEVLDLSDIRVHIPMKGVKESLNVSVAFGIAAHTITKRL